jgi:hypothetical protein
MGKNEGEIGKTPRAAQDEKHPRRASSEGADEEVPSKEEEAHDGKEIGGDEGRHPPAVPKAVGNEARKGELEVEEKQSGKSVCRRQKPEGELFFQDAHVIRPPLRY